MNQESFIEEFRLPITHRVTENVDLEDVEQASLDTKFSSSKVGFVFFKRWVGKEKGLGKQARARSNRRSSEITIKTYNHSSKYTCYSAYATNFVVLADYYCVLKGALGLVRVTRTSKHFELMNSTNQWWFLSAALLCRLQGDI